MQASLFTGSESIVGAAKFVDKSEIKSIPKCMHANIHFNGSESLV